MKILKKFFLFLFDLLIFIPSLTSPYQKPLTITKTLPHDYSWITFLEDAHQQQWVAKQVKDLDLTQQYELVLDTLGAIIAQSVGVRCNNIILIPPYSNLPGHIESSLPLSLHSVVPGIPLSMLPDFDNVKFQQKWWPKNSIRGKKWPLAKENKGLSQSIIHAMARNPQLACIVAVDTFLSNTDGHNDHIFYDQQTGLFWKIDYGELYRCNLPEKALIQLACFINLEEFSDREKEALQHYKNTLQKLGDLWNPTTIIQLFDDLMKQAGFFLYPHLSSLQLEEKVSRIKQQIYKNYQSTKKLIKFIEFIQQTF